MKNINKRIHNHIISKMQTEYILGYMPRYKTIKSENNKSKCHKTKQGIVVFSQKGSKDLAKTNMILRNDKVLCQVLDNQGYRQFMSFKSWEHCFDIFKNDKDKHIFEIIASNTYCKPYLDIEWLKDNNDTDSTKFISQLIKNIKLVFVNKYKIKLNKKDILILSSSNDKKESFHIIINKYNENTNTYYVFHNNLKPKEDDIEVYLSAYDLCKELMLLNPEYNEKKQIDTHVYTIDREFRTIYSTKHNDPRIFLPYKKDNSDYLINNQYCENYLDYIIQYFKDNSKFCLIGN